ncbi:MAG: hypothetical protein K2H16_01620 [Prevotella sp.]|nr:hypothetical protein [Prevotella sp.]
MALKDKIMTEVENLRQLKRSVFGNNFHSCDIEASDACLSADVLLVPLYWYWEEHFPNDSELEIEQYLEEAIDTFPSKAYELISRLIIRTEELDSLYKTRPLKSYRKLLQECYPDYYYSLL